MADPVETDPYERWKQLGRPGGSFEAWQAQQGGQAAPQVSGGSVAPPVAAPAAGQSFADMIRQASTGQSEDFGRFSNEQILAWQGAYDPLASALAGRPQFRSEGGGGALVDKPTECPPGTTLHGSNCVAYANLPAWAQGSYGMGDTGQRAGGVNINQPVASAAVATKAAPVWNSPLQTFAPLSTQTPVDNTSAISGDKGQAMQGAPLQTVMAGLQAQPNQVQVPSFMSGGTGSLQGLMAGLPNQPTAQPQAFQGGLTNMMARRNKTVPNNSGRWFA